MRAALWIGGENLRNSQWVEKIALCDFVVAADQGWHHLQSWGKEADFWVGDGDSLRGGKPGCSCISLPRHKDKTDTQAALHFLLKKGVQEVWLFCGTGKRMDHWLSHLKVLEQFPQITRWFTAYEEIMILSPGADLSVKATLLSLFPLGHGPWELSAQGLVWPLNHVDFEEGYSLSNKTLQGECRLKIFQGRLMLLLPEEKI